MATATKNARTIQASASNGAGSTTTGSAINLTTALGGVIVWKVTNGATGPTVACTVTLQLSHDNSTWYDVAIYLTLTGNNVVSSGAWPLGVGVMYARVKFSGNTVQAVTVEAYLMEATSIS